MSESKLQIVVVDHKIFDGPNDPGLPENVQDLSETSRRQWVAIFNSAMTRCMADDGSEKECEGTAFAQANGVVFAEEADKADKQLPTNERGWTAEETLRRMTDQERKFFKNEVNYTDPSEDPDEHCGLCHFFIANDRQCQAVEGPIDAGAESELFINAAEQESAASAMGGALGFANIANMMKELAFLRGTDVGQPLGVINDGATTTVASEGEMSKTEDNRREYKTVPAISTKIDEEQGIVEHFVAVMGNVDLGGDVIQPGAFTKTITERQGKIRVVDAHNTFSVLDVVGKPLALWEVGREMLPPRILQEFPEATGALMARTQFLMDTPEGSGIFKRIKAGAVDEYSIGYDALDTDFEKLDTGETVRHLRTIKLFEYSPVVFAMNPATTTLSAKGDGDMKEKIENAENVKIAPEEVEDELKAGRVISRASATRIGAAIGSLISLLEDAGVDLPQFGSQHEDDEDDKAGFIGIGTTTPDALLHISGDVDTAIVAEAFKIFANSYGIDQDVDPAPDESQAAITETKPEVSDPQAGPQEEPAPTSNAQDWLKLIEIGESEIALLEV